MTLTVSAPPRQIGRYEILGELGRGAMGVVYKARDPLIDRLVALKTIAVEGNNAETEMFRQRFFREARSAGGLSHPNIVVIHDVGESDQVAYIAMEFLSGQSLREILDSGTVLPAARIADIAAQVADGLAFAHQKSIVHRDIKPANIMVTDTGLVKITDFGIALLPTGTRTVAGTVFGSPKYISPERVRGNHVDGRSDIFSLGAVLYEMLTGLPPFNGTDLNALLYQILSVMPLAPSSKNRKIAPTFDLIVATALAKNPADRYRDARDLAADLRHFAEPGALSAATANAAAAADSAEATLPWRESNPTLRLGNAAPIGMTGTVPMFEEPLPTPTHPIPPQWRRGALFAVPAVVLALVVAAVLAPREDAVTGTVSASIAPVAALRPSATTGAAPNLSTPVSSSAALATPAPAPNASSAGTMSPPRAPESAATTRTPVRDESSLPAYSARAPEPTTFGSGQQPRAPGANAPVSAESRVPAIGTSTANPPARALASAETTGELAVANAVAPVVKPAVLGISVAPWGEVYVNGRKVGVSPPLTQLKLAPGRYTVELRNSTFAVHRESIDLRPQSSVRIVHRFE